MKLSSLPLPTVENPRLCKKVGVKKRGGGGGRKAYTQISIYIIYNLQAVQDNSAYKTISQSQPHKVWMTDIADKYWYSAAKFVYLSKISQH